MTGAGGWTPGRGSPAALRNAEPIRAVLAPRLPPRGLVLEVASGGGHHACTMAAAFPGITWQSTDANPDALAELTEAVRAAELANLRPPLALDVTVEPWPVERADAVVCINMVHIAPWEAALALLRGAARALPGGGSLFTYGPYRFGGVFTAPSNAAFDASLRARDPRWGVRDVEDLEAAARAVGLSLEEVIPMPANNHILVFRRAPASLPPAT